MIHKPHTWIELNKNALEHNLAQLKTVVGAGILAPVIKGNGYGHGLLEVSRVCQISPHVDYVCVASLSEALTLRADGFAKPILVLVYLDDDAHLAVEHDIDVMVYDRNTIDLLNTCAKKIDKPAQIHIKIDTGLSRLGIPPEQTLELVKYAKKLPYITIHGLATHFAQSQIPDQEFTQEQIKIFNIILAQLERADIDIPFKHTSNSAALLGTIPLTGNFFRSGISVYGYWSSNHIEKNAETIHPDITLKPVLTWKTRIFDIKTVPEGRTVGYGRTYTTRKETMLASIPVGYADGYCKQLEGNTQVLIGNHLAPNVGTIGMNTMTIDITDTPDAHIGTEVTLVGDDPGIRADKLASRAILNPREITTNISSVIKRKMV